jgi:ABC-type cobalt transport system substrate-binding protein
MYRNKLFSVVLFAAIVAGVVVVACKDKDKTDTGAEGAKAGKEMCDCATGINPETTEDYQTELFTCVFAVAGKYEKYFAFVYNPATFDGNIFSAFDFKDEGFQKGFLEEAQKCADVFGL